MIFVGTAGWAIPKECGPFFSTAGSNLERYGRVYRCTEINSTFKHAHRASTYQRWADSTPLDFRFSVKLPYVITHVQKLQDVEEPLDVFFRDIAPLGGRVGPLLVQLPPSLGFDNEVFGTFMASVRAHFTGIVVCEPRHADWFGDAADLAMRQHGVARVAADPARAPSAGIPGGHLGTPTQPAVTYFRWHGSPVTYRSSYTTAQLNSLAARVRSAGESANCWCIFDNTAAGAAASNALELIHRLEE